MTNICERLKSRILAASAAVLACAAFNAAANTINLSFINNTGVTVYDLETMLNGTGNNLSFSSGNTAATITTNDGPGITYFFIPATNKSEIVTYWTLPNNQGQTGLVNNGKTAMTFTFTLPQNVTLATAKWTNATGGIVGLAAPPPAAQSCALPSGASVSCPAGV